MIHKLSLVLSQVLMLALLGPINAQDDTFGLTIIYTNDIHAENDSSSDNNGVAAHEMSVIDQVRAETVTSLLLDSADRLSGTFFHIQWKSQESVMNMNMLGHDIAQMDNSSSAQGVFLEIPMPEADVNLSVSPDLTGEVQPYVVLGTGDQRIGIIGLVVPETEILASSAPELVFDHDLVTLTQTMVDELSGQGVHKIILLTHVGINADEMVGQSVSGVDVIVSGHSLTQLSNPYTSADSQYPVVLDTATGEPVLVVRTNTRTKYLGRLDVEFDADGVLVNWDAETILLSKAIPVKPDTSDLAVGLGGQSPEMCPACL